MMINAMNANSCFNPRPRVGGDTALWYHAINHKRFNPRPRVGGDIRIRAERLNNLVSIHAPAWGATVEAPMRELVEAGFNPRPRVGGDLMLRPFHAHVAFQSTPPRGGRHCIAILFTVCICFNPRPRVGGDRAKTTTTVG